PGAGDLPPFRRAGCREGSGPAPPRPRRAGRPRSAGGVALPRGDAAGRGGPGAPARARGGGRRRADGEPGCRERRRGRRSPARSLPGRGGHASRGHPRPRAPGPARPRPGARERTTLPPRRDRAMNPLSVVWADLRRAWPSALAIVAVIAASTALGVGV